MGSSTQNDTVLMGEIIAIQSLANGIKALDTCTSTMPACRDMSLPGI